MEQKLDDLSSITELKQNQEDNQKEMSQKLQQLKRDVHAGQKVAAEWVVKKLKRDKDTNSRKKDTKNNTYLMTTSRIKWKCGSFIGKGDTSQPEG